MHEDKNIIELLRRVDQAEVGKSTSVDVSYCRQLAARKKAARTKAAGALTVTLLGMVCLLFFQVSGRPKQVSVGDRSDSALGTQAMEDTQHEIEMIEQTLELYQVRRRLETLRTRLAELEAQPLILAQVRLQEEINLTAAITLDYADRLANEVNDPLLAAAEYRWVVQHYPGTSWALSAADALARMP